MIDITPIIEAVCALVGAIIAAVVVPYIKSRTTAEERAELSEWVKIAVSAAEQMCTGSGRGAEKKAYVLTWLSAHGVTVDPETLDAMVEAAVYALNHPEAIV